MAYLAPALGVGDWFCEPTSGRRFEIITIDKATQLIEIQYTDGDMIELDPESWSHLAPIPDHGPQHLAGDYTEPDIGNIYASNDQPFAGTNISCAASFDILGQMDNDDFSDLDDLL